MRAAEIRKAASESLLEFVAQHGKEVAMDTGGSLLVSEIMLQADGGTYFRSFLLLSSVLSPSNHGCGGHWNARIWLTFFGRHGGQRLMILPLARVA